ncbi:fancd2 [Lycorma delicatula]|uniref:fancd2 n=1 Tax=Lycorma delicatula TaxID=130591 RepID=UPI003F50D759
MYKRRSKKRSAGALGTVESSNGDENVENIINGSSNQAIVDDFVLSPVMFDDGPNKKQKVGDKNKHSSRKMTYLEEITHVSGMRIHKKDIPNELGIDQMLFIQKVSEFLAQNEGNVKRNVEILMEDLRNYCNKLYCLKNALSPTVTVDGCDVTRGSVQDSLMRLFLHVDPLYQPVAQFLIDKMAEITADEDMKADAINWVRMFMQSLKFLDNTSSSSKLGEQLFDIIHSSSDSQVQVEIIYNLPSIISEVEHAECATELSKLVRNERLLGVTLESLSQLSVDSVVQLEVQETLISSLRRISPDVLSGVIKFLLTTCNPEHVDDVLNGLRTEICLKNADESIQVIVFKGIQDCMYALKFLSSAWLKNISGVKSLENHRPLDIIILLIIFSISVDDTKKRAVFTVLKNKIRDGLFKKKLLTETFEVYTQVVIQYFQPLMRIASMLLKSPDLVVADGASHIYSGLFQYVGDHYCKLIINELLVCIGATGPSSIVSVSAFKILNILTTTYANKVKQFSHLLIVLLNKVNELGLNEARQLLDMLCRIAYSSDDDDISSSSDCEILQSELNMLVQKQFSSLQPSVVSTGVVGIVMLIKHIACIPDNASISNEHIDRSIEEVELSDYAKKARPLFDLLIYNKKSESHPVTRTSESKEQLLLLLDQLTHMIMNVHNLDQTLNHYMVSVIRKKMNDAYLITYSPSTKISECDAGLPMNIQFCLNEDVEENIAVNIGVLSVQEAEQVKKHLSCGSTWPLSCLNSTFRLLQSLEKHDLNEIDALLGCGLVFPTTDVYSTAKFNDLSPYQQHVVLNCLFYAINWFRGVISCFSFLIKKKKPQNILIRLRTVVWLMDQLSYCLPLTMDYIPPQCYFRCPSFRVKPDKANKKKKPGKKKEKNNKKKNKNTENHGSQKSINEIEGSDDEEEEDEGENNTVNVEGDKKANLSLYQNFFRELDIDVWLLLTQPLTFTPTRIQDGKFTDEMGPSELLFILDDFVRKLEHKLPSSMKRLSNFKSNSTYHVGFESIDAFDEIVIIKNTITLLGNLTTYLEKTFEYTQNLLKENDEILDSPAMFLPGPNAVKHCQHHILSIFSTVFSWHGFKDGSNNKLFLDGLQKIASRIISPNYKVTSKAIAVRDVCNFLSECASKILDIKTAAVIVSLMKTLTDNFDSEKSTLPLISKLSYKFLSQPWFDSKGIKEQGSLFNRQLNMLLQNFISCSENQLEDLRKITVDIENDVCDLSSDKDSHLQTFPVFNRSNINWYIDGVLKGMETTLKTCIARNGLSKDRFKVWSKIMDYLVAVNNIVKSNDNRIVLRVFVKGMLSILRLIKSNAIATFEDVFVDCHYDASLSMKKMQVTTRFLQSVCNHTKVTRDASMQHYLPLVRALMESVLFDIRHIFLKFGCMEAWFLGNMKHRNMKGEEILSQDMDDSAEDSDENSEDKLSSENNSDNHTRLSDKRKKVNGETDEDEDSVSEMC